LVKGYEKKDVKPTNYYGKKTKGEHKGELKRITILEEDFD